ncbi:hypothetical protein [Chryseobacterium defluvii]|uniref:Uncharacterized protein n=1 Tax=Chryseobacterium defluvii TaxID=160396 RepID=A0A495SM34_9FLAO|nr:hypothetical protein [Chryseobacterium defluvii]RKT01107.1 hypothetical protein BCF58_0321 [Chryseobacterium defluvii]
MKTKEIFRMAKKIGLSPECKERMSTDLSIKNLCEMFFDGDDWSMENNFPDLSTLRRFKGISDQYGLYTDYKGIKQNEQNSAFFGSSEVSLYYDAFNVSTVIIRHESKVKIKAIGNAIVLVNILDSAELEVESYDNASVRVFCYDNLNVRTIGNVKVQTSNFNKNE